MLLSRISRLGARAVVVCWLVLGCGAAFAQATPAPVAPVPSDAAAGAPAGSPRERAGPPPATLPATAAPAPAQARPAGGAAAGAAESAAPTRPLAEVLSLSPGATCLERERLVHRVARWLQRERVEATLRVTVEGDPHDPHSVSFVIERSDGERSERAIHDAPADCDQMHAALALSIALAIDANIGLAGAPGELPADEALVAPKQPRAPAYFKLGAAILLHAASGLLTDVSGGASARLELGFVPWLDLRLGALGSVIEGQTLGEFDQGTFAAALIAGRGDVCLAHSLAQLRLLACGGGMAGMFGTRGEAGFATKIVQNSPWGALVGSLEAQAELASWLSFSVAVDLVLPFAKRTIRVADASGETAASRTLSSVAVLVGAGPVVRVF